MQQPDTLPSATQIVRTAAVALALVAGWSCAGPGPVTADASGGGNPLAPEQRPAPDFTLNAVDGTSVKLSDMAGQVTLIDFWATWCAPCREEIPMFKELYETYRSEGFTILAISDEGESVIRDFVDEHEIPYPNLIDEGTVTEKYEVLALPTAFLVDRDGNIVESLIGPKPRKVLKAKIEALLRPEPAT